MHLMTFVRPEQRHMDSMQPIISNTVRLLALLISISATTACHSRHSTMPHLVHDGDRWYVTDLDARAAQMAARGHLFAAYRAIPGTRDREAIAVLRALGPAVSGSSSVRLAEQCVALGRGLERGLAVEPLRGDTSDKVGQCLARIVGRSPAGVPPYVTLDVGTAEGLLPGDQYSLLGKPVVKRGFAGLVLDTENDLRCQISDDYIHNRSLTIRCMIVDRVPPDARLENGFAVFTPRPGL